MILKFCTNCDSILQTKETDEGIVFRCVKCNLIEADSSLKSQENIPKSEEIGKGSLGKLNPLATEQNLCKNCGYNKAEIINSGTFNSNEDEIILIRCGKCGLSKKIN